jgi:hypothetical protein
MAHILTRTCRLIRVSLDVFLVLFKEDLVFAVARSVARFILDSIVVVAGLIDVHPLPPPICTTSFIAIRCSP